MDGGAAEANGAAEGGAAGEQEDPATAGGGGGRVGGSTGAAVAAATAGAAIRTRIARAFVDHGEHENELMEDEPFLGASLLPEDNRALLDAMRWADGPLDEALAFSATNLPPPYVAFHWRSARVLGWNSADVESEEELRRVEATAMWCASVFVRSVQRHVSERGYRSVVILSDVPASNGSHPLVPSRGKGDVDHRVVRMMSDAVKPAPFVKIDVQGENEVAGRDKGTLSIVDHILGEKADMLVTCMDGAAECAYCTDVESSFAASMAVQRLADRVPRARTTLTRW